MRKTLLTISLLFWLSACTTVPVAPPSTKTETPRPFGMWAGQPERHVLRPGVEIVTTAFLRIEPGVITRLTECAVQDVKEIVGASSASEIGAKEVMIHHDRQSEPKDLIIAAVSFPCVSSLKSGRHAIQLSSDGTHLTWEDQEGNATEFTRVSLEE